MLSLPAPMAKQPRTPRGGAAIPERRPPRSASRRKRERRREQQRLQAAPQSRLTGRVLGAGAAAAAVVVVLLVVLLTRGHGATSTSTTTPTPAATPAATPTPAPLASLTTAAAGSAIDGIQCQPTEPAANQSSVHLSLYVDGAPRQVPAGVGIGPPRTTASTDAGPFVSGACYYALLTHTGDGIIHVEPPTQGTKYTLGQFFDLWGQPLTASQAGPASGAVTVYVDGTQFTGDPRTVPLSAHAKIQIDVGTVVPFMQYTFPAGD